MLDLDAGKYALFVWPAYGLTALTFLGMIVFTLRQSRIWRRRAEQDGK
ncbi:heme exporter protein CcmD [Phenylobacterium sp.]|nr:heme exporter protein CcmD [Phenylobacterium sp.]